MELLKLKFTALRNEEHYKFNLDFSGLVSQFTPDTLGITNLYPRWQASFDIETAALGVVRSSAITDDLLDADAVRDECFSGLAGTVRAATNHYDDNVTAAANRLCKVFDTYQNVSVKPYDQETAAIIKLVADLESTYAADVAALGIAGWVADLKAKNLVFEEFKNSRYTENTTKSQQNLRLARIETDNAYRAIVKRVNALIEVNGTETYAGFVAEMNERIKNYQRVLAMRKGHKTTEDESAEGSSTPEESE